MAPTIEQALRAEIQAHKQALDHALATLQWLTVGHNERQRHSDNQLDVLKCRACEELAYIRLHLAGWATTGTSVPTEGT